MWRLGGLFHKEPRDLEIAEELESHLQLHIDDNLRAGMTPEEARRERSYWRSEAWSRPRRIIAIDAASPWLETLFQDVRFGLRMLRKNPGFTAVAVLTLALGIGANTAMFSVLEGVVLAPLRYRQPGRLVVVWQSNPRFPRVAISYPNFIDWQRNALSFEQMAAFAHQEYDLTNPGTPEHIDGRRNILQLL